MADTGTVVPDLSRLADMRLLDDAQRGALWQVIAERWAVR